MGSDKKRQTDDPLETKKRDQPNSSQGPPVGPNGVITIPEITVVGDPSDGSYDPPLQDDKHGNELVKIVAAAPEALAEGAVRAVAVELGADSLEKIGEITEDIFGKIWDWLTDWSEAP